MMQFSTTRVESKKFSDVETPWDGPSSEQGKESDISIKNKYQDMIPHQTIEILLTKNGIRILMTSSFKAAWVSFQGDI